MTKTIVLDANILVRTALGKQLDGLIREYAEKVEFVCPEQAFDEAELHLPTIIRKRGGTQDTIDATLETLHQLALFIQILPVSTFEAFEEDAKERLAKRDEKDWAYLALALALHCPIWTEDKDFFGCGVAIWTSDRIKIFLTES